MRTTAWKRRSIARLKNLASLVDFGFYVHRVDDFLHKRRRKTDTGAGMVWISELYTGRVDSEKNGPVVDNSEYWIWSSLDRKIYAYWWKSPFLESQVEAL